jgi:transcriptional regulator with GAF, ATPase, and Fis domain
VSNAASHDRQLRSAMADLAGNFTSGAIDVDDALANVTAAAVNLIPGIDYADILLIEEGQFQSVAPTAAIVKEIDAVQQRVQEGPCLEAAVADSVIRCPDLDNDLRWPQFAPAATGLGVHSMLSYQLYSYRGGVGALNLLGSAPQQFTFEAEGLGAMLATHAAVALIAANTGASSNPHWPAGTTSARPKAYSWNGSTSTLCKPSNYSEGFPRKPTHRSAPWRSA